MKNSCSGKKTEASSKNEHDNNIYVYELNTCLLKISFRKKSHCLLTNGLFKIWTRQFSATAGRTLQRESYLFLSEWKKEQSNNMCSTVCISILQYLQWTSVSGPYSTDPSLFLFTRLKCLRAVPSRPCFFVAGPALLGNVASPGRYGIGRHGML